jgi:hypothetical protein
MTVLTKEDLSAFKELFDSSNSNFREEMSVLFESQDHKLSLLAENQQTMMDMLAPKTRVEELEEKVEFLESIVMKLAKEMSKLSEE